MKKGTALATALLASPASGARPTESPGLPRFPLLSGSSGFASLGNSARHSFPRARPPRAVCVSPFPVASIPLTTAQFLGVLGGMS
jgi:hypothetical protein